jgi:hypothetical protein
VVLNFSFFFFFFFLILLDFVLVFGGVSGFEFDGGFGVLLSAIFGFRLLWVLVGLGFMQLGPARWFSILGFLGLIRCWFNRFSFYSV